jgi:hypothetical protein
MSVIEKRKHERIKLTRQPKGSLMLRVGDQEYPVAQVQDISSYGINVMVEDAIANRTRVTVKYVDDALNLDVYGVIAWNAKREAGAGTPAGNIMGIELFSPTLLTAVLGAPE